MVNWHLLKVFSVKTHSHLVKAEEKAEISFDVSRFFKNLLSLSSGMNEPLEIKQ